MSTSTTAVSEPSSTSDASSMYRIEVRLHQVEPDATAARVLEEARQIEPSVADVEASDVYLLSGELSEDDLQRIASELLADPITQDYAIGAADTSEAPLTIEVHHLPGVMDPTALSTQNAIAELLGSAGEGVEVRTASRYDFHVAQGANLDDKQRETLLRWAERSLGNPVIHSIHGERHTPASFVSPTPYELNLVHVALRDLSDAELQTLSREAHLFLSLEEMQTIQSFYRDADRNPTDIELETLAQTWSEHCVHKTLKATIRYTPTGSNADAERSAASGTASIFHDKPGHTTNPDGTVTIDNLLKSTIAAATRDLRKADLAIDQWLISVFDDNAGIVRLDDTHGVAIKVETHNHPSAIEPYGGAATGIGGCIRDVMGTGLVAKPIANTDVFAVAHLDHWQTGDADPASRKQPLPAGVIHPRRTLGQVVSGIRDYGNRMGIPTVNGAVLFHDDYVANPLVFAGCIGLIPIEHAFGDPQPGDRIVALGGRTGRDGIHGATFSSAELTDTHADEFAHAVQIGNAITQKRVLDVLLKARDAEDGPLFTAITDCGAGGFSSAVGEMGEKLGADVQLDAAPLKYAGLSHVEIWISEAQERMVLSVPPEKLDALQALCDAEHVELANLGSFGFTDGDDPTLRLNYRGEEVGRLPMHFLHDGLPKTAREATGSTSVWPARVEAAMPSIEPPAFDVRDALLKLLAHPNIASKHRIIRQYDHEVQGGTTVKPLVGPQRIGPSDAAVIRPRPEHHRGVAIACGVAPWLSEKTPGGDSYQATLHAVDEAVRNAVCVGAQPFVEYADAETRSDEASGTGSRGIAILDNFCWPSCDDAQSLGTLVRAAEACQDAAMAYRTPFVSGKDSLHNQFTTDDGKLITIPPTLLVTALGMVPDVRKCVTMDAKRAGSTLLLVGDTTAQLGGSHLVQIGLAPAPSDFTIPSVDLTKGPATAIAVASLISAGHVLAAHDCSDGGLLVAAAEMAIAGSRGLALSLEGVRPDGISLAAAAFAESPARYLLEVATSDVDAVTSQLQSRGITCTPVGTFTDDSRLSISGTGGFDVDVTELRETWRNGLVI